MRSSPLRRRQRTKSYRLPKKSPVATSSKINGKNHGWRGPLDIENLTKTLAAIGAFLYLLGLVSVNGYLLSLGVADFALLRIRFIYTGALLVGVGFVAGLPLYSLALSVSAWRFGRPTRRQPALGRWTQWRRDAAAISWLVMALFMTVILSVWVLYLIPWPLLGHMSIMHSKIVWSLLLVLLALFAGGIGIFGFWMTLSLRTLQMGLPAFLKNGLSAFGSMAILLALIMWAAFFMVAAYPNIPEQVGGGKARPVRILLEEDAVEGARDMGIPVAKGGKLSAPVNLIYDGSETYVIGFDKSRIVQLDKSIVKGLVTR
jgi:hypothetical protein